MKYSSKVLVSAAIFGISNMIGNAQVPPINPSQPPSGPFQQVTEAQYDQAIQTGQALVISPTAVVVQDIEALLADARNLAVVNEFIRQHPDLRGLAALVAAPTDPNVVPTGDGNYLIQVPDEAGGFDTVETLGRSSLLEMLADSMQASTDPAQQLALYQSVYSQYATLYGQVCGLEEVCLNLPNPSVFTPPSSLQNASLGVIESALSSLVSIGSNIIKYVPVSAGGPVACSADIGASVTATNGTYKESAPPPPGALIYGDQTNSTCGTPKDDGIFKNFTWLNENLLSCVKKQGVRGTCHIFAAVSALEELIARDTGSYVNLSEQDFNEFEKLGNSNPVWGWPAEWYKSGGNPGKDLQHASAAGYHFAYENQWDYNPAYGASNYMNTCQYFPSLEPGCSNSSPEAPEYCYSPGLGFWSCYFSKAPLSGSRSPYQSNGAISLWNSDQALMASMVIIELAFHNAVVLGFNLTSDFGNATHGYIHYDPSQDARGIGGDAGHVVHVVGYIDNSALAANPATASVPPGSGGGYFIIKNSWGTCSGDVGYYYMPVDYLTNRANSVYAVQTFSGSY